MKIEDLIDRMYDKISICVDIEYNEKLKRLIVSKDDYDSYWHSYEDRSMECHRAWEDFKQTNAELKQMGLYSVYEENEIPDIDDIRWELRIRI